MLTMNSSILKLIKLASFFTFFGLLNFQCSQLIYFEEDTFNRDTPVIFWYTKSEFSGDLQRQPGAIIMEDESFNLHGICQRAEKPPFVADFIQTHRKHYYIDVNDEVQQGSQTRAMVRYDTGEEATDPLKYYIYLGEQRPVVGPNGKIIIENYTAFFDITRPLINTFEEAGWERFVKVYSGYCLDSGHRNPNNNPVHIDSMGEVVLATGSTCMPTALGVHTVNYYWKVKNIPWTEIDYSVFPDKDRFQKDSVVGRSATTWSPRTKYGGKGQGSGETRFAENGICGHSMQNDSRNPIDCGKKARMPCLTY